MSDIHTRSFHRAFFAVAPVVLHNAHGEVLFLAGQVPTMVEAVPGGSQIHILIPGAGLDVAVNESPREVFAAFKIGECAVLPPERLGSELE